MLALKRRRFLKKSAPVRGDLRRRLRTATAVPDQDTLELMVAASHYPTIPSPLSLGLAHGLDLARACPGLVPTRSSSVRERGRDRHLCKECGGQGICEHGEGYRTRRGFRIVAPTLIRFLPFLRR